MDPPVADEIVRQALFHKAGKSFLTRFDDPNVGYSNYIVIRKWIKGKKFFMHSDTSDDALFWTSKYKVEFANFHGFKANYGLLLDGTPVLVVMKQSYDEEDIEKCPTEFELHDNFIRTFCFTSKIMDGGVLVTNYRRVVLYHLRPFTLRTAIAKMDDSMKATFLKSFAKKCASIGQIPSDQFHYINPWNVHFDDWYSVYFDTLASIASYASACNKTIQFSRFMPMTAGSVADDFGKLELKNSQVKLEEYVKNWDESSRE